MLNFVILLNNEMVKYYFEGENLGSCLIGSEVDLTKRSGSKNGSNAVFPTNKEVGDVKVIGHECYSNFKLIENELSNVEILYKFLTSS